MYDLVVCIIGVGIDWLWFVDDDDWLSVFDLFYVRDVVGLFVCLLEYGGFVVEWLYGGDYYVDRWGWGKIDDLW